MRPPHLDVDSVGAGLGENRRDGWITANLQFIFGAFIPLQEIIKVEGWIVETRRAI